MEDRHAKRNNPSSSMTVLGILLMVTLASGVIFSNARQMKSQEQAYIQREEALSRDIEAEEKRTAELKEKKKYVTTDIYIKEVAREKLGLLSSDEILLKESNNN